MKLALSLGCGADPQWWPPGASLAIDFQQNRAMRLNAVLPIEAITSFSRPSTAWLDQPDGSYAAYPAHQMRRDSRGLHLEPASTNINPVFRAAEGWSSTAGSIQSILAAPFAGLFSAAMSAASGGSPNARTAGVNFAVLQSTPYHVTLWFAAGTSGRVRLTLGEFATAGYSHLAGPIALPNDTTSTTKGPATLAAVRAIAAGHQAQVIWTPNFSGNGVIGIGPDSASIGADVLAFGAQVETLGFTSPIVTVGTAETRAAEWLGIELPPGNHISTLLRSDGTTQVMDSSAGMLVLPVAIGSAAIARVICHPA